MKLILLSILIWAAVLGTGQLENGYKSTALDPDSTPVSIIDSETANQLFRKFNQSSIPFRFPLEGCYARATAMTQIADKEGVTLGKVTVEGDLMVNTGLTRYPLVRWGWHIAPVVYVKNRMGGISLMVLDPSLFSKPVSLDEWKKKMLDKSYGFESKITKTYYGSRFQYKISAAEYNKTEYSERDLKDMKEKFDIYQNFQDMSPKVEINFPKTTPITVPSGYR